MKRISLTLLLAILCVPAYARDIPPLSNPAPDSGFPSEKDTSGAVELNPGVLVLTGREIDALIASKPGASLRFPSFDRFTGNEHRALEFKAFDVYAPGAIHRILADGSELELARDSRRFYLATNDTTGIGLVVDPASGETRGFASKGGRRLEISGNFVSGLALKPVIEAAADSNSCETRLAGQPSDIQQGLAGPAMLSSSAAAAGDVISYEAVVAIDTDTEWLEGFGDDTTAAMNWITEIFLAMNVFFERDVETRLLVGDVTLRVGTDDYTVENDRFAQLNEFGAYWKDNMGHVDRQFAAMLSGRNIGGYSFSGIAWIDQFCQYGRSLGNSTVGSFNYNAIGSGRTPGNTALYLGHEIGHNMGSPHTHCYDPPVDHCYNGAGGGCYTGDPECPAGGRGTVMSYCHVGGSSGAGCGTSNSEFHPVVQSLLEGNLADEQVAGCILEHTPENPEPELELTPADGASLDFGELMVGELSSAISIQAGNSGQADLTLSCELSGANPASFQLEACQSIVPAGESTDVSVRCLPLSGGDLSASLDLTTNDADESQTAFTLLCRGTEPPAEDSIFSSDFEN